MYTFILVCSLSNLLLNEHDDDEICTFTGSHLRAVTDADDDDDNDNDTDNAERHSTTTRATYRQLSMRQLQSEMTRQEMIV